MERQKLEKLQFDKKILDWAQALSDKMETKLSRTTDTCGEACVYSLDENGKAQDMFCVRSSSWVNGFWPGLLWLLYQQSGKAKYRERAELLEKKLDQALFLTNEGFDGLHHDVGFMWVPTSVMSYKMTKNPDSRRRALIAANFLAARWDPDAGFLIAWNQIEKESWSIIDTMMNLPLLYWASEETNYRRFARIGELHALKASSHSVRADGSVNHIVRYAGDGSFIESLGGQGYAVGSAWSRGCSWAVYGFALSYMHTGNPVFLDTAKKAANYFLAAVQISDYVPLCDFRSPKEPVLYDATAGAVAADGMLTLAALLPEYEREVYVTGALRILKALEERCCDFSEDTDLIMSLGAQRYDEKTQKYIVYGDYFYLEALLKVLGNEVLSW